MASFKASALSQDTAAPSALGSPPIDGYGSDVDIDIDDDSSATYYDVLKCAGQFASPSVFFAQPLKPAHSASQVYPWASHPLSSVVGSSSSGSGKTDSKHRLRRVGSSSAADAGSEYADSTASSSVFRAEHRDNTLPPSVFRLPGARAGAALSSMTIGGRSLRRATQVQMSVFDRKVNLV
ncbi:hypothetical protein LPJ53_000161 [Coemansia erecta]|uniref:Uncharacterized protein n=1 Tax=Coemansia erecta TaxID=147472 RepID=A0A9W8CW94_9FUNG|nr:hypothetical protein LPJ53_000161 [Coemansia erecta]